MQVAINGSVLFMKLVFIDVSSLMLSVFWCGVKLCILAHVMFIWWHFQHEIIIWLCCHCKLSVDAHLTCMSQLIHNLRFHAVLAIDLWAL